VRVREPDVFISKKAILDMWIVALTIDRFSTFTVHCSTSIASLDAESFDYPMNPLVLIVLMGALFTCAEHSEVLDCLRTIFIEKLKDNSSTSFLLLWLIVESYLKIIVALNIFRVELRKFFVDKPMFLFFDF
jgi:hypothetical protein